VAQAVERALQAISYLAESERSLGDVAEHLGVHKSTALRLLQTLEAEGFARRENASRYGIGFRVVSLAHQVLDNLDLFAIAHQHLVTLASRLGSTFHLGQVIGPEVIYVDKVEGRGAVKMYSMVGRTASLYTSGLGKAVLAHVSGPLRAEMLDSIVFKKHTASTITSRPDLEEELSRIQARGWAEDNAEFEDFINCVAVPILDSRGRVQAALSMTAVRALTSLETLREHVPELRAAAQTIAEESGWAKTAAQEGLESEDHAD
jgi:DNA-binding IclR family transcriptional regulator